MNSFKDVIFFILGIIGVISIWVGLLMLRRDIRAVLTRKPPLRKIPSPSNPTLPHEIAEALKNWDKKPQEKGFQQGLAGDKEHTLIWWTEDETWRSTSFRLAEAKAENDLPKFERIIARAGATAVAYFRAKRAKEMDEEKKEGK